MKKILIIPSLDIKEKKIVRVVQGIAELGSNQYGNDPVEMALIWRSENAKIIHVVDFDFSLKHSKINFDTIGEICEAVIIPVTYGGGILSMEDANEIIELGASRLVIGSLTVTNFDVFLKIFEKFGPHKITIGLDIIDDEIIINGRKERTGISPLQLSKKLADVGVKRFIITDVSRNGMLTGPNIELCKKVSEVTNRKVTLSGGVGNYKDLIEIQNNSNGDIDSVIVGRALYENRFSCQKLWRVAETGLFD